MEFLWLGDPVGGKKTHRSLEMCKWKQAVKGKGRLKHFCRLTEWGFATLSSLKWHMPDQDGVSWALQCVLRGRLDALGLWWKHRLAYSSQVYLGKTCWDPRLHFRSTWTSPIPSLVSVFLHRSWVALSTKGHCPLLIPSVLMIKDGA